jgi:glycosyltransferase involved in cell wall biosynthesis
MKVLVLSSGDPEDVKTFSGTTASMIAEIRRHDIEVDTISDVYPDWFIILRRILRYFSRFRVDIVWSPFFLRLIKNDLFDKISQKDFDKIMIVANASAAYLIGDRYSYLYATDATFKLMENYYERFSRLSGPLKRAGDMIERNSILRSSHSTFSSEWARGSAIRDYGAVEGEVSCIQWGCNIDLSKVEKDAHYERSDILKLLFVGVEWRRKGGDMCIKIANALKERGQKFQFDFVGSAPEAPDASLSLDGLRFHGRLSKSDPSQYRQLVMLFGSADFLVLPTQQDCTPMVIGEANAFSVPVVARETGGVGSLIDHNRSGLLMKADADASDYVNAILNVWNDEARHAEMKRNARSMFEEKLNWKAWAEKFLPIIRSNPSKSTQDIFE